MGRERNVKHARRLLRRMVGPELAARMDQTHLYADGAISILSRGFFGRLKWFITGR
jgi:hypothetical protein